MPLPNPGRLLSVNLAVLRRDRAGDHASGMTGIDKRPTEHRVELRDNQVIGDTVVDTRHHGGYDQAVYAYASEDAAWWSNELGRPVPPGSFGENLTTDALDVTGAVIGERWAIGTAVLEVSVPRIPCTVFQAFWDVPHLIKRFTERGRPGAYLRIITEGEVGAGDPIDVISRPEHGVTIGETFRALTGDRSLAPRLLEATELPNAARNKAHKWLAPTNRT